MVPLVLRAPSCSSSIALNLHIFWFCFSQSLIFEILIRAFFQRLEDIMNLIKKIS